MPSRATSIEPLMQYDSKSELASQATPSKLSELVSSHTDPPTNPSSMRAPAEAARVMRLLARRVSIRVAEDRMAAFIALTAVLEGADGAPQGEPSNVVEGLRASLAAAGVVAGIDEVVLSELAARAREQALSEHEPERQIASGAVARPGRDGFVEVTFEEGLAPGRLSADGHMDFFDRGLLKSVVAAQLVAIVHAPEAGQVGFTVAGEALPAKAGVAAKLKLGAGVELDAEGGVRARHAGVVLYKPGESLDVVAQHVHQGAVDLHSGHLSTDGSLVVKGDVERLLQVQASGDLEVVGSVSGGSLRAGGSIRVSGSVRGGDDSRVIAEHDVIIRSCESADVTSGGVLRAQEAVNSQLRGAEVVVTGRLRGGAATAERLVTVKEAGTPAGTETLVRAGEPLELPDLADVQRAVVMQKLRRMAERGGVRDAFGARGGGRAKGGKLGRVAAALSAEELQERAAYAERRAELEARAMVEVQLAHPGVELRIGNARHSLEQAQRGLRYVLDRETGQLRAERITP